MGLLDRFKNADDAAPEGDDVDLDPTLEDEDVLDDEQVAEPPTDWIVQDPGADPALDTGGEFD